MELRKGLPVLAGLLLGIRGLMAIPDMTKDRSQEARTLVMPETVESHEAASDRHEWTSTSISGAAPFRASGMPSPVRYGAAPAEPPVSAPGRPPWKLSGILAGDPSVAVFEDEGTHGTHVMGLGDTMGPYRLAVIDGDSAVVASHTMRWTFALETPWS